MNPEIKEFTVKEVFEALEKNGFPLIRGEWVFFNFNLKPIGACILGQASLNLKVYHSANVYTEDFATNTLWTQLNRFKVEQDSKWWVRDPQDGTANSHLAQAITYWNDLYENDSDTRGEEDGITDYYLKTYEEVVNMAREIMEPYFDEILYLAVWNDVIEIAGDI